MTISKAERTELRSVVRQQFKVLAAEVQQRRAELVADADRQIAARYADDDKAWREAEWLVAEAARKANREANDVMRGLLGDAWPASHDKTLVGMATQQLRQMQPLNERTEARTTLLHRIDAQVRQTQLALARQEANLLTDLASDAVESAEARAFLRRIPTVSELVPAVRLQELEQRLQGEQPGDDL
jgi:hypothetical protein